MKSYQTELTSLKHSRDGRDRDKKSRVNVPVCNRKKTKVIYDEVVVVVVVKWFNYAHVNYYLIGNVFLSFHQNVASVTKVFL